jgi:choline kinase
MLRNISVVIPVAGRGSRLGAGLPKCLVPVFGRPIIEWQLESLKGFDVSVTLVTGYMSSEVIEFVGSLDPSVRFIENPDFEKTGTAASVRVAAERIKTASVVSIDGDVLVHPSGLAKILNSSDSVLGVTKNLTTDGVKVEVSEDHVVSFASQSESFLEWSGVFKIATQTARVFGDGHVFESLEPLLPLRYEEIECHEVDTPADLEHAETWMSSLTTSRDGQWRKK